MNFRDCNALFLLAAGMMLAGNVAAQNLQAWPVTHVSAGGFHALFISSNGRLWGMGDNTYGELGLGSSISNRNTPQLIVNGGVGAVACGNKHSLFINGSSLWSMGYNFYGDLGDGSTNTHFVP